MKILKFFKKNGKDSAYHIVDIDGYAIEPGDKVMALRYDLGICLVVKTEHGIIYESLESGKTVSFAKMIDATTKYQKVRKLDK